MVQVSSTRDIPGVSPREILEFVLDLDRYREVDPKITEVGIIIGPDLAGRGSVELSSRLRFGPVTPDVQDIQLDRWARLRFTSAPRQRARLLFDLTSSFLCWPSERGTTVTHDYTLRFRLPVRWLEPLHRGWLQAEVEAEMDRLVAVLAR